MKKTGTIFPAFFIFLVMQSCIAQNKTSLTAAEFDKAISNGDSVQVLDVRTAGEYQSGHIANALQADWNDPAEFNRRIAFIDKNKPVYVYCLSGGRSGGAAAKMREAGYNNVYELQGGIIAWQAGKRALEGKAGENQMNLQYFNNAINNSKTVLVDFGATWCPPCRKMEPILISLQKNNPGKFTVVKVDGGTDQDMLLQYKVTALPVFIIFKDGKQVWRKDGVVTEKELTEQL
ncbi:MAG: thioredoxin fold domain-containing protein [Ferruginibacter sp.]|nr:thioredoxin fold domain-containing protein [Ferruginibacter sp.]